MSAVRVKVRGICNDCGRAHGRPAPNVALCLACRRERLRRRERTAKYLAYKTRYNRSPKGKITHGKWYDRYRERLRVQSHINYVARHARQGPSIKTCETVGCGNTFIRIKGSRGKFCRACAAVFFGPAYARRRKAA